jgi:hypothetical protein
MKIKQLIKNLNALNNYLLLILAFYYPVFHLHDSKYLLKYNNL